MPDQPEKNIIPQPYRYFIINKPANMVSQFVSPDDVGLLGDLAFDFPEGTHAIGRLDSNSEGLLILTTNKKVTNLLFLGEIPHKRTYWVNVAHAVSPETLERLRNGIHIEIKGGVQYLTAPCEVAIIQRPGMLSKLRNEERENVPNTWLQISLTEGKYHQVRKMVRTAGHRCRRLVRVSIEDLQLDGLEPGGVREIEEDTFFRLLKISNWKSAIFSGDLAHTPPV
ncbi:pseudouridine synthase [Dyadobacter sediminis]|uniref:Pseudouridine synthase n=1 Tax=Dyadobacter sediminis TaxID=1493691 RepID=A0A5R9K5L3_9BACT|nr:pseudouridine synthase [Dyadobacter sediminis]TLU88843.1 rRNA pseudouridine synthase [Dyadobacter sediminis]GGC13640.1 pseudouridine synthase [Dyadobacter sediminis]